MLSHSFFHNAGPRRERVARGAFVLWMAAYAVIVIAIVAASSLSGSSRTAEAKGLHSLQAKMSDTPQSSIAPEATNITLVDDKG